MEENSNYKIRVLILVMISIGISTAFNKIFLLMHGNIQNIIFISPLLNIVTISIGNMLSGIGKFIGAFYEKFYNKYLLMLIFFLKFLCIFLCLFVKNSVLFFFCRNLEGLLSGISLGIVSYIISQSNSSKSNFITITSVQSIVTCASIFIIYTINVNNLAIIISILGLCAIFVINFISIQPIEKKEISTITQELFKATKTYFFWKNVSFLGIQLGITLTLVTKLSQLFSTHWIIFQNINGSIFAAAPFLCSIVFSFFPKLANRKFMLFNLISGIILSFFGYMLDIWVYFLIGTCCYFLSFSALNPITLNEILLHYNRQSSVITFFNSIRSVITAIMLIIMGILPINISIMSSIMLSTLVLVSLKNGDNHVRK